MHSQKLSNMCIFRSQSQQMKRETINPKSLFDSRPYGFSQIVIANPGKMVFISGQVAWDENLNIVGGQDLAKQTQKALDNINAAIKAAGGTLENIVVLRIYTSQTMVCPLICCKFSPILRCSIERELGYHSLSRLALIKISAQLNWTNHNPTSIHSKSSRGKWCDHQSSFKR